MPAIMLYDGNCILCRQSARLVKWLDWLGRVERLNAQDQTLISARFPELAEADILGEIFVRERSGEWLVGFFGMRYLAWQLPLTFPFTPLLYLPFMNRFGPKVYAWVAKRRYKLNQLFGQDCPDGACKLDFGA